MHYHFWEKYGHLTLSKHSIQKYSKKKCAMSHTGIILHMTRIKNRDYSGKNSVLRCQTLRQSAVLSGVYSDLLTIG